MVSSVGALQIVSGAPQAGDSYVGGVAVSPAQQIRTSTSAPQRFDQGRAFRNDGSLCINTAGGAVVGYVGGLPVTSTGALKCELNPEGGAADTYVGGIRVGANGIHVVDATPPAQNGFSSGFSSGFGF
jgi:hypothetical protein